jgi:hypothetical protein
MYRLSLFSHGVSTHDDVNQGCDDKLIFFFIVG